MLRFLPHTMIGFLSFIIYILNTVFWLIPIIIFSFLKAIIPLSFSQKIFSYLLDQMASNWVACNTLNQKLFFKIEINVTGLEQLNMREWYLVLANHQSWVDIVVLQRVLHNKIPFLKFFLKKELLYVPILGMAWWALDFPFMKRHSQAFLKKNPHLKGDDIKTTRKACEKFKHKPVSIMSFIEGTRFSQAKHDRQKSPFQYLLKPKAGGIGFVLDAMGEHLNKIVNITIYYPDQIPSFPDFICGRVKQVRVHIEVLEIDQSLKGDYFNDRPFKINFQKRVNQIWQEKDVTLTMLNKE
ncbi:MAG: acyltransferase [Colwellia sp.]|nr:acyltransferase [Colwellia sp.]